MIHILCKDGRIWMHEHVADCFFKNDNEGWFLIKVGNRLFPLLPGLK
jgi:hypothetical protein